ncbi:NUDIX hydrolase [Psychrosphaera sp. 1_MG-2023]|uniref:NUDIX hydrolase n=1 Tax=unclassified Psychrosphaera TaxID=2641570 RepID=UPI0026E1A764|nr:NUDIX domain-containing protein [Psychrosphaera sp. 1_MG-2023]MDO6718475.1 NUDIX hydrolase [Psychrosphaera sp. 1_MG-2023]
MKKDTPIFVESTEKLEFGAEDTLPNVSVDNLIFSLQDSKLKLLLVKYTQGIASNKWGVIGHWVKLDESLDEAALRVIKKVTLVKKLYLEQLSTFGAVDRYPLSRIITVAYYALVRFEDVKITTGNKDIEVAWFDVNELPDLIFDHQNIVEAAIKQLRYKVRHEPVGFSLLPEKFSLLQLQEIYEAILGQKLDKPNFRRKILKMNLLIDCKEKQTNVAHRAAGLYQFDETAYRRLTEFGFSFEL